MRITLSIYVDPLHLRPDINLHEAHLAVAEAFAKILNDEQLIFIESFDLSVEHDPDRTDIPPAVMRWLKRFLKVSRDDRKKQK